MNEGVLARENMRRLFFVIFALFTILKILKDVKSYRITIGTVLSVGLCDRFFIPIEKQSDYRVIFHLY